MRSRPQEAGAARSVFIVHGPITYSLALAVIAARRLDNAWLIGARGMHGARVDALAAHDGGWSIEGCLAVLQAVSRGLPDDSSLSIYLPHSLTLAAKLLMLSPRTVAVHYLEEGYTAVDQRLINHPVWFAQVDSEALLAQLEQTGLLAVLALDAAAIHGLNQLPSYVFDGAARNYAGAIACSDDAFPGLGQVDRVTLAQPTARLAAHLVAFPSLLNRHPTTTSEADRYMIQRNGDALCSIAATLLQQASPQMPVVIKLHPRDAVELPSTLLARFDALGARYDDYCAEQGVDPCLEPALLNFSHYSVFGRSAMQKYVAQFQGAERLSCLPLPF